MKRVSLLGALLLLAPVPAAWAQEHGVQASGRISAGVQQFDNDTKSSKFTEYRDVQDNVFLREIKLNLLDTRSGRYLDLSGASVIRDDQRIRVEAGQFTRWRLGIDWNATPHTLSNKAQSPYTEQAVGQLVVPATVPITFKTLNTVAANAPQVVAMDSLTAAYARSNVRPVDLRTQRNQGMLSVRYSPAQSLAFGAAYSRGRKTGSKLSYGPIGDRPPRTLNIQLAEPVNYRTSDLTFSAEHLGRRYQARLEYLFSDFANNVNTLLWQNIYTTAAAGAEFDTWDRAVSVFGRRPLPPDNRYHRATVSVGGDLPRDSRLTASASYSRMNQDETLLPYSYDSRFLANPTLPRPTAQARMNTTHLAADYSIAPVAPLNLRASYRRYDLDNQTPESRWQYVTSDTRNLNGTVSYKNKRINLAYAYTRQNLGLDATYRLPFWRSSLEASYQRENIDRAHREAATAENIVRMMWRARPVRAVSLRARYLRGQRDGGTYDWTVTRAGYWYLPSEANDNDNPVLSFNDHPDMRRFDVSDRKRDQADVTAGLNLRDNLSLSATVRVQQDDYDSDVLSIQPMADVSAFTPGDQLGLLTDKRRRYSIDAFYGPVEALALNAFAGWESRARLQRSLEFNENNKRDPATVAIADLGPWTRGSSEWTADTDDRVRNFGGGATYTFENGLSVSASYSVSLGRIDVDYSGYGVVNFNGAPFADNFQFGFRTPSTTEHDLQVLDARVEFPVRGSLGVMLSYTYERYTIADWQQEDATAWFEPVLSEYLLRDTSRSHQWGNRLFNLGSYLAPSYRAHSGYAAVTYRF